MSKRSKVIKAEQGKSNENRYGCPFSTATLDRACTITGLGSTEMEKLLKAGGDPVEVSEGLRITKGPKGQNLRIVR